MTTTITITKDNFWQKIWIIYKELLHNHSIKIKLEKPEKKLLWTEYEENSYKKAKKDLENGDVVDFSDLLTKYNFFDLKDKYEKNI